VASSAAGSLYRWARRRGKCSDVRGNVRISAVERSFLISEEPRCREEKERKKKKGKEGQTAPRWPRLFLVLEMSRQCAHVPAASAWRDGQRKPRGGKGKKTATLKSATVALQYIVNWEGKTSLPPRIPLLKYNYIQTCEGKEGELAGWTGREPRLPLWWSHSEKKKGRRGQTEPAVSAPGRCIFSKLR